MYLPKARTDLCRLGGGDGVAVPRGAWGRAHLRAEGGFDRGRWRPGSTGATRLAPKVYGEKVDMGGSAESPRTLLIQEVQGRTLKPVQIVDGEAE